MILDQKEKSKVQSIMANYKEIHGRLNFFSKKLENIKEYEKTPDNIKEISVSVVSAVSDLENERNKEKILLNELSKKYGSGTLNFNTFEYDTI